MALATGLERFRLYVAVRGTLQVEGHRALARASGHFIFSLIGLKRVLFTNIFQEL